VVESFPGKCKVLSSNPRKEGSVWVEEETDGRKEGLSRNRTMGGGLVIFITGPFLLFLFVCLFFNLGHVFL
jgi:hypothetical protein